jgi:hypothetical protein
VTCGPKRLRANWSQVRQKDAATKLQELSPSRFWRSSTGNWMKLLTALSIGERNEGSIKLRFYLHASCTVAFYGRNHLRVSGCTIYPLRAHNWCALDNDIDLTLCNTAPELMSVQKDVCDQRIRFGRCQQQIHAPFPFRESLDRLKSFLRGFELRRR